MDEIIKNLNNIYKKSKYLERLKAIQGDNQFNNKKFRGFCNGYIDGRLNTRLQKMTNKWFISLFE